MELIKYAAAAIPIIESFMLTLLVITLAGLPLFHKKMVLIVLFQSIAIAVIRAIDILPLGVWTVLGIIVTILLIKLFYKTRLLPITLSSVGAVIILGIVEAIVISLLIFVLKMSPERIYGDPYLKFFCYLPIPLLLSTITFWLRKKRISLFDVDIITSSSKLNKSYTRIFTLLLVQNFLIITVSLSFMALRNQQDQSMVLFRSLIQFEAIYNIIAVVLTAITLIYIRRLKNVMTEQLEQEMVRQSEKNIRELVCSIQSQRHDFLNHMQTVSALVQMKKFDRVEKYIKELYGEIKDVNEMLQAGPSYLTALINTKRSYCRAKAIDFEVEIDALIDKLPIGQVDACKILGNLIDNSIKATNMVQEKFIQVKLYYEGEHLIFEVYNNGKIIEAPAMKKLFNPYFTTDTKSTGLGLYIVKNCVEKYGGTIEVDNVGQKGVVFVVTLPNIIKKENQVQYA
jgi:two-component system, LytTR family, sensor histidine kinase AgrC